MQIACGIDSNWYINSSGELYGCGYGSSGSQGSGNTSVVVSFTKRADNVKDVVCTQYMTWYINSSGELYGCGENNRGQQGAGNTTDVLTFTKRADDVVQIACGEYSADGTTWYVNSSNEVYGCGYNSSGQQGSGNTTNVTTFTKRN